jgi:hypothetical protein
VASITNNDGRLDDRNQRIIIGPKNPIIGREKSFHAKVYYGSQRVGNARGRIACGVIGVANPK